MFFKSQMNILELKNIITEIKKLTGWAPLAALRWQREESINLKVDQYKLWKLNTEKIEQSLKDLRGKIKDLMLLGSVKEKRKWIKIFIPHTQPLWPHNQEKRKKTDTLFSSVARKQRNCWLFNARGRPGWVWQSLDCLLPSVNLRIPEIGAGHVKANHNGLTLAANGKRTWREIKREKTILDKKEGARVISERKGRETRYRLQSHISMTHPDTLRSLLS